MSQNQIACKFAVLLLPLAMACAEEPPPSGSSDAPIVQEVAYAIPGTDETIMVSPARLALAEHFDADPRWVTVTPEGVRRVDEDGNAAVVDVTSLPPELATLVAQELERPTIETPEVAQ